MREEDKPSNDLPDFSLSADERPVRRRATGSVPPKRPTPASGQPAAPKSSGGGNGLVWLLMVLVLVLAGGGVWQFKVLQTELADTRAELNIAQDKLSSVTGEITATGENLDQSGSALRSELQVVNSEVRKLWDVANKRNRQWILINKDNVVKALKQSEGADKAADKAADLANKASSKADSMTKELKEARKQLTELDQLMKAVTTEQLAAQSEMTVNLEHFTQQFEEMKKLLAEQKKTQAELDKKVENQQQAVKAIDSFRLQVNRKMQQLEGSVRDLTQPPEQGLGLK